jgi:hypothetical protein
MANIGFRGKLDFKTDVLILLFLFLPVGFSLFATSSWDLEIGDATGLLNDQATGIDDQADVRQGAFVELSKAGLGAAGLSVLYYVYDLKLRKEKIEIDNNTRYLLNYLLFVAQSWYKLPIMLCELVFGGDIFTWGLFLGQKSKDSPDDNVTAETGTMEKINPLRSGGADSPLRSGGADSPLRSDGADSPLRSGGALDKLVQAIQRERRIQDDTFHNDYDDREHSDPQLSRKPESQDDEKIHEKIQTREIAPKPDTSGSLARSQANSSGPSHENEPAPVTGMDPIDTTLASINTNLSDISTGTGGLGKLNSGPTSLRRRLVSTAARRLRRCQLARSA